MSLTKGNRYLFAGFISAFSIAGMSQEEVVMGEVDTAPYSEVSFVSEVSGVGRVAISMWRDGKKYGYPISKLEISYAGLGRVGVSSEFFKCIPGVHLERATFFFVPVSEGAVKSDWFSSVVIPFGVEEGWVGKNFPAVEIEVLGGKSISRVKFMRDESSSKFVYQMDSCPQEVVRWALEGRFVNKK